ncbi:MULTISPECIES: enoyl-[acyl-carrier-protein] reductase FabK [Aerococcus]|uniref:Probable nitronate monooxygenase n=1 Tax=Aerococcus sanguinicola TaxID=119206 RepID=A0A5N1GN43_9LACT|nr:MULTISPECIES: enoyl-[acyl-carrier-protein] reductase FabK [Aerococcus]KAA9301814.1 enoyl-[acyl-carrier-protein] reductase FabK [Aerococcus sanguinicola]MDK6368766.1 enoyl-[acyl-carrier-protein] reductase FabK [Aerococcus sp. UMB9870]MDK6679314.1 enoyl-[acyl-carrier-protein] reductase FabK [Aerococcus sp. UMB8608]MDK6685844.1 enoyl-[acyl-carrier-protein] reductase FabK [Aerococcus sp. UMB8623]MDK6939389.1 enoyl-[acyl-carrier-protein] reductase FabK [Aerococcus sp. UMB8487]
MKTKLWEEMGVTYPIVQGAMAWVADADLASAVSNAGALGVIGTGHDSVEIVQQKVEKMQALTDKPFAVNVMLLNAHVDELVDYLCQSGVKIVTTGAGSPAKYMKRFKAAGIKVIPVVASVALAKRMAREGVDALIVEGMESGGHIGKLTTMALVPQVVDAVDIPVIAAGGIGDGRGMAAALMLGASGIQVGTRFVVAKESNAHPNFKEKIIKAKDIDTVITGESTGHPVRVLRNKLTKKYLKVEHEEAAKDQPDWTKFEDLAKGALKRAVVDGDVDNSSLMAGQIAGLIHQEETCEEIIQSYMQECRELIQQHASMN